MPVANVFDKRSNRYDVRCDVVFEPSCHDNSVANATQFDYDKEFDYFEMHETTIYSSVLKAMTWKTAVTVFIYDPGFLTK